MKRHENRIRIISVLYQHLLLDKDITECMFSYSDEPFEKFENDILEDIKVNEDNYISNISSYLKDWSFNRLNLVDQAILLLAVSEMTQGINDKAVIIDEAINLAKEYSDETSYKYINGVLDRYAVN